MQGLWIAHSVQLGSTQLIKVNTLLFIFSPSTGYIEINIIHTTAGILLFLYSHCQVGQTNRLSQQGPLDICELSWDAYHLSGRESENCMETPCLSRCETNLILPSEESWLELRFLYVSSVVCAGTIECTACAAGYFASRNGGCPNSSA